MISKPSVQIPGAYSTARQTNSKVSVRYYASAKVRVQSKTALWEARPKGTQTPETWPLPALLLIPEIPGKEPHPFRMDKTQHGKDEITDERLKPEIRLEIRASFRSEFPPRTLRSPHRLLWGQRSDLLPSRYRVATGIILCGRTRLDSRHPEANS